MTLTAPRLPAALDAAMKLIEVTATSVAGRVSETLGAAAQSSHRIAERDLFSSAQFELRRNLGAFQRTFSAVLRERVQQELAPAEDARRKPSRPDWQTLSLVDDHEVEDRMFADRIAQLISHDAEAELRELAAYLGTLLDLRRTELDRHPLRAEVLGVALHRAIDAVSQQRETRQLLAREIGHAIARAMPACYGQILHDLQALGIQPLGLTVRGVEGPGHMLPGLNSAYAGLDSRSGHPGFDADLPTGDGAGSGYGASVAGGGSAYRSSYGRTGHGSPSSAMPSALGGSGPRSRHGAASGAMSARTDAQLMTLLRRLTVLASRPGEFDAVPRTRSGVDSSGFGSRRGSTGFGPTGPASAGRGEAIGGLMAANLIRAHREELMQASTGQLDHMVIDVVGSLFDQILSDSRVPPQMARQIARLQLPVLRVALNDPSFFSSRRHPVRRFVNRIASLACAFDDFDDGPGKELLGRVRELVQDIVEGDFDQIDIYSAKLAALEGFNAEQTQHDANQSGAAATLDGKESELRVQQRYMLQLQAALLQVSAPAYLRDFLTQVWSQALVLAVRRDGPASDRAQRYRRVGRDLVMSVQPKGSPMLRKKFLMQLPPLMKDLNDGLQLIGWPQPAQREFFAQLLPAHAESLKGQPLSELDYNMMAKQLEAVFGAPVPSLESLSAADPLPPVDEAVIAQRFSSEEAQRVGFVAETAVDWSGRVDIDLGADTGGEAPDTTPLDLGVDIRLDFGDPAPAELTPGAQLIDHVKPGFAYQMHLKDEWQKVRLAHVSAGRSFFVFTRGQKHQETISMTSRMLARMCETGRLRAVESAYLMERATQRARKQLAALRPTPGH